MTEYVAILPHVKLQVHGTLLEEWSCLPKNPSLPAKRFDLLPYSLIFLYNSIQHLVSGLEGPMVVNLIELARNYKL